MLDTLLQQLSDPAVLVAAAVVAALGYALTWLIWPYRHCRRCRGTGYLRSPWMRAYRRCPRCQGRGKSLRLGPRLRRAWKRLVEDLGNR